MDNTKIKVPYPPVQTCYFYYLFFSPPNSWEINGETVETVSDSIFLGSKITADGDCSHEIKRCLLLGRKVMTKIDNILKHRYITWKTKVHLPRLWFFQWSYMDVRVGL